MLGQADVPVVQLGVSEELVHSGREASITCRVQNQGDYKSKLKSLEDTCKSFRQKCRNTLKCFVVLRHA